MANNIDIRDKNAATKTMRTTDNSGVHSPHHVMEILNGSVPTPITEAFRLPIMCADSDIAAGIVTGRRFVNKFGRNRDVDSGTLPEDMWNGGGVYTGFPTSGSAETLQVFSSDANDTSAGTGARTVRLTGLDGNYNEIVETVTLNGTTPVTTTNTFWRMHTSTVLTAGSGGANAGEITARHSTATANVFMVMPAGRNQSNMGGYTIPAGYTGILRKTCVWIRSATSAQHADGELWIRQFGQAYRLRRPWTATNTVTYCSEITGGIPLPEKTDIIPRITSCSANNMDIICAYDVELIQS